MIEAADICWLENAGRLLRNERIARGLSLQDVAQETKISPRQLTAIEEGDWERLPAPAYVRGFVRIYCRCLGLTLEMPPSSETPPAIDVPASKRLRLHLSRRVRWALPLTLGFFALILSYLYHDSPPPSRPVSEEPPAQQSVQLQVPLQQAVSSARNAEKAAAFAPVSSAVKPVLSEPDPHGTLILKLKVNQECWLNITIDGAITQQYDLRPGDLIEWKAHNVIALDIGNAGGIEAELNGHPLPPFGATGKVVHKVLRADTLSAPPAKPVQ